MSHPRIHLSQLLALTVLVGTAREIPARAAEEPSSARLGKRIENLPFKDASGKSFALDDLKGAKGLVVVFLSFDCPVSTSYCQVLADLARTYQELGIAFVGLSSGDEDAARVARLAREFKLPFPVFKDERHVAANAFKADVTPEAFLLDAGRILRYRGRIDDAYAARLKKKPQVSRHDLRQAIDEVLAGKPVRESATAPVGCPISRERAKVPANGTVTFYRDVLPILQNRCQSCHRPNAVGPFALLTYKQAVNWAADIKEYTGSRKMPPWKPVAGVSFHGDRRMREKEIATLATWVDGGTPEGLAKDAPASRQFEDGWQLGKPDLVLTLGEDFQLGPTGPDHYRYFVLPTNLSEDRYVSAVEVQPGNRRIVHHAVLFYDRSGKAGKIEQRERQRDRKAAESDRGAGYSFDAGLFGVLPGFIPEGGLGGWSPGMVPHRLPEGTGYFLPKGADVIVQMHYQRSGRVEKDRTSVGLYFTKKPKADRMQGITVPAAFLSIPAGAERHRVKGSVVLRQDCRLHAVMPHMHLLGRDIKVTMMPPGGPARTLVAIADWDFNQQETYFFCESILAKAGTRFEVEGTYDNSAKNPSNPRNPPATVYFGEQTSNEMCIGVIGATTDKPGRIHFDLELKVPGWIGLRTLDLPLFGM